jgi:uncharacterized membrane protein
MSEPVDEGKPRTLVGISFGDPFRAQEFLTAATRLSVNGSMNLLDAVLVAKDETGRTVVRETVDPQPGRSALSGALWAGLFGLILGGPVGWVVGAGVGAGTGAVAAKIIDHGVSDEWVGWFRQAVEDDTTTVVLLAEDLDRAALVTELERFEGASLVYANVDPLWLDRIHHALGEPTPAGEGSPSDAAAGPPPTDEPTPPVEESPSDEPSGADER